MNCVAKDDRAQEFPLKDGQKGQRIDARGLAHETRGNRQAEQSVSDRLAERAAFR